MMPSTVLLCTFASCLAACEAAGMPAAPATAVPVEPSVDARGVRPDLAQPDDLSVLYPLATSQAAFDRGYCASCHLAQAVRAMVGETAFHLAASNPELRTAAGRPLALAPESDVNVHMFGYKGERASIHQRTINEAVAVTAYVNATLLR